MVKRQTGWRLVALLVVIAMLWSPVAAWAEYQPIPGVAGGEQGGHAEPLHLDLSSTAANMVAPAMQMPVTIQVGNVVKTLTAGTAVTPAEYIAAQQVLNSGHQSLVVGASGAAAGGTFSVHALQAAAVLANLVVPQGVTALHDFGTAATLDLTGNLNNSGTFYALSTNAAVTAGVINAANIFNNHQATLTSVLPASVLAGLASAVPRFDLTLNAIQNIINAGQIASSGNLNLNAGGAVVNALPPGLSGTSPIIHALNSVNIHAADIINGGVIAAATGNVNINTASQIAQNISINNTSGILQALNGSINIGSADATGKFDLNVHGGDLIARELKLHGGLGTVRLDVNDLQGRVNISAGAAHVSAASDNLTLGSMEITGDPTYYNRTGSVTLSGSLQFAGQALAIVARDDIVTDTGASIISTASNTQDGGSILMVAGADFTTSGGDQGSGDTGTTLTITGPSANGGQINLAGTAPITTLSSMSTATPGNGGDIQLIAFGAATGPAGNSGQITLPASLTIQSGGSGSGTNGSVTLMAGASSGNAIMMGGIDSTGGTGGGGNIEIQTVQPFINGSVEIAADGSIANGSFEAGDMQLSSLQTGHLNSAGSLKVLAGNSLIIGNSVTYTARTGDLQLGAPNVLLGDSSTVQNLGPGDIIFTSAGLAKPLDFIAPDGGEVHITTSGGSIKFTPTPGQALHFSKSTGGAGPTTVNLSGGPVFATTHAAGMHLKEGVLLLSDNIFTAAVQTSGGIIGIAFQPFVGTYNGTTLASNAASLGTSAPSDQAFWGEWMTLSNAAGGANGVADLFTITPTLPDDSDGTPVQNLFGFIATYGQGTNDFSASSPPAPFAVGLMPIGTLYDINTGQPCGSPSATCQPYIPTANYWNTQAAAANGMKIAAGVTAIGLNCPGGNCVDADGFNTAFTLIEAKAAIDAAKTYPGTVTEIVIGNEMIFGPVTVGDLITVMNEAKAYRDSKGFQGTDPTAANYLPITTRQKWDVLAGVNNPNTGYQPQLLNLLTTVAEGHIYGNMYAYFDPGLALPQNADPTNTTKTTFQSDVTTSMTNQLTAWYNSFNGNGVTIEMRIGETGWPTAGTGAGGQPANWSNPTFAKWYFEAMQSWTTTTTVAGVPAIKTIIFEGFDEPIKGPPPSTSQLSEAYFGLFTATGTSANNSPFGAPGFTITGVTQKFEISIDQVQNRLLKIDGAVRAASVSMTSDTIHNLGEITATAGNVLLNTKNLTNNSTTGISTNHPTGSVIIESLTDLTLSGTGSLSRTATGPGSIKLSAGGSNTLSLLGNQTYNSCACGNIQFNAKSAGASIEIAPGVSQTIVGGASVVFSSPLLLFTGDGSAVTATGASPIEFNSGQGPNPLAIIGPNGGTATIATTGGSINFLPTAGQGLVFDKVDGNSVWKLSLNGGPIMAMVQAGGMYIDDKVHLLSDNTFTAAVETAGGIIGISFQPYVGPYNGTTLPSNAASLGTTAPSDQAFWGSWMTLSNAAAGANGVADLFTIIPTLPDNSNGTAVGSLFGFIATYGQGTNDFAASSPPAPFAVGLMPIGTLYDVNTGASCSSISATCQPYIPTANYWNTQAAAANGMKIAAGVTAIGLSCPNGICNDASGFSTAFTLLEAKAAIDGAKKYPGTVTEIVIGNEMIFGPVTIGDLISVMNDAKTYRDSQGFQGTDPTKANYLPITTRQKWDVLAGVNNTGTGYQPQLVQLLTTVAEGHVYGNMYAYFDPGLALPQTATASNTTQADFQSDVTTSMTHQLTAWYNAFNTNNITIEMRIGETGWPTAGTGAGGQPAGWSNTTFAQWYFEAMQTWTTSTGVAGVPAIKTVYFEGLDEPWKGPAPSVSQLSEAYFGLFTATGSFANNGPFGGAGFTITGISQKFPITINSVQSRLLQIDGVIKATSVNLMSNNSNINGSVTATTGDVTLQNTNMKTLMNVKLGPGASVQAMGAGGNVMFNPNQSGAMSVTGFGGTIMANKNVDFNGGTGSVTVRVGAIVGSVAANGSPVSIITLPPNLPTAPLTPSNTPIPPFVAPQLNLSDVPGITIIATDATPWSHSTQGPELTETAQDVATEIKQEATEGGTLAGLSADSADASALSAGGASVTQGPQPNILILDKGNILITPKVDSVVVTHEGEVHVATGSSAFVIETGNDVAVYNLHDGKYGSVKVVSGGSVISLLPGKQLVLTRKKTGTFATLNPGTAIAYRDPTSFKLKDDIRGYIADFSIPSALAAIQPLRALRTSTNPNDRRLARNIIKNAAIMAVTTPTGTPFKTGK